MTHDKFCELVTTFGKNSLPPCNCLTIQAIRKDEREKVAQQVYKVMCDPHTCPKYPITENHPKKTMDENYDCNKTNILLEQVGDWIQYNNFPIEKGSK